ncbi:unnamed protein product [Cunninghamella echinulata]
MKDNNNYFPPSPIESPSSTTIQKEYCFPINTTIDNKQTTDYSSIYSPPTSPLILSSSYYDHPPDQTIQKRKSAPQLLWEPQWEKVDIQSLTLENAKLQRANRILKVDREAWLQEQIQPLDEHIRELTVANIRWQRASRLLQQELDESQKELKTLKENQLQSSTLTSSMGPEYQYLVNMVHFLQDHYSQTSKKESISDQEYNLNQKNVDSDDHTIVKQQQQQEKRNTSYYNKKIYQLEQKIQTLSNNLNSREHDVVLLTNDLSNKDQQVTQLNNQLNHYRKIIEEHGISVPSNPLDQILDDILSENEQQQQQIKNRKNLHRLTCSSIDSNLSSGSTLWDESHCTTPGFFSPKQQEEIFIKNNNIPGSFLTMNYNEEEEQEEKENDGSIFPVWMAILEHDQYVSFILLSMTLGLASKLGIHDDWMVPLTLFSLILSYLRNATSDFQVKFSS